MDRVYVVGVSGEGRASLIARAVEIVDGADLLVGGARHLAMFPESRAEKLSLAEGLGAAIDRIGSQLGKRRVVVLASGDPGFFGVARALIERLGKERVEIVPNVSSMQLAFARLGESWEDAAFASVHGRPLEGLVAAVRGGRKVAILTGGKNTPAVVARWLLDAGIDGYRVYLCEDLGGPDERVREFDLDGLASVETSLLNVVVLIKKETGPRGDDVGASGPTGPNASSDCSTERGKELTEPSAPTPLAGWAHGIPEEEFFHRGGMITKVEVRLAGLARLGLSEESILWDVGAGSGSVAIEAAMVARKGQIYAIERDPEQVRLINRNLARFGIESVEVVQGEAPAALEGLPDPDALFVGGSGGRLAAILELGCERLRGGGRVVVNAATLETATAAMADLRGRGFQPEATLMQISRGKGLGALTHFEAMNPVFIVSGRRP